MNILVCVKQVPGSSNVKKKKKTGLLIRSAKGNKLNPYDLFALETARKLREAAGGTVIAVSMGPPQAREALEECVQMGCDGGVLFSDRAFGGADVLATSYTISQGIRKLDPFDLILCGKQTTDGDTAQVGAELAEHLHIPHLSNVTAITSLNEDSVTERLMLPCLICTDADINTPRLPSYKRRKDISHDSVRVLTFVDFEDGDPTHYGLKGSPTQVQKIFPPEKKTDREMFTGPSDTLADGLVMLLKNKKFI